MFYHLRYREKRLRKSIFYQYLVVSQIETLPNICYILTKIKEAIQKFEWLLLSGRQDSNLRPPHPKCGAITGLRYAPSLPLIIKKLRRGWDSNPRYSLTRTTI